MPHTFHTRVFGGCEAITQDPPQPSTRALLATHHHILVSLEGQDRRVPAKQRQDRLDMAIQQWLVKQVRICLESFIANQITFVRKTQLLDD